MNDDIFFTISGLRGIIGKSFTPELVSKVSAVFGTLVKQGAIVVGRDTRRSGEMVRFAAISGLLSVGRKVIDLGIVPTPTVLFNTRISGAKGGLAITASHNPPDWNALKFVRKGGNFMNEEEINKLKTALHKEVSRVSANEIYEIEFRDGLKPHIQAILESNLIDTEGIRQSRFKVVIDAANGAASEAAPELLSALNCEVVKVHCDKPGHFERELEPTGDNLQDAQHMLLKSGADIGFATDADGDRLVIIPANGKSLSEEWTLPISLLYLLNREKSNVVINASTSLMVDYVAKKFGVQVIRSKVGEAFVTRQMKEKGCTLGGEGNGGVIVRPINFTRDALVGIAVILSLLVRVKNSNNFRNMLPTYYMKKVKLPLKNWDPSQVASHFPEGRAEFTDGIRVNLRNSFLHIRASNTEPILRVIVESDDPDTTEYLIKKAGDAI